MASEITRRRPGGVTETLIAHSKAGSAWVPSHRVAHYVEGDKGWKLGKSSDQSTADRPASNAPEGASNASTKEG